MSYDHTILKGTTSKIIEVMLRDGTTGAGKTAVAHTDVTASYVREGATRTAITLAAGTAGDSYSSGKWAEVDSTNCPGLYQLHLPDASLATGVNAVTTTLTATGVIDKVIRISLLDVDLRDSTDAGLSRLDAAISSRSSHAATDIVSGGAITTSGGAVSNVTTVATTTTNSDMRGTDSAFLAASAPANFAALGINASGHVTRVTTVDTTTANSDMRGTDNAFLAANAPSNFDALLINASGHVTRVTTVDTTTTNTDMRGTDGANTTTPPTAAAIADQVWDELLTGAAHNTPTSAGRRLRELAEVGLYEGASVWIDTVNGSAGTGDYENGTVNNPNDNIADATTIANSVGLSRFRIAPASSFTLASGYTGFTFVGDGLWTLALGGQALNATTVSNAEVSGTCTSTDPPMFASCSIGTVTLPACYVLHSRLESAITLTSAGTYHFEQCLSAVAGTASPSLDFGAAVGSTNVNFRHYSGGIEVRNMGQAGTDNMSLEGDGALTINANCTGGTIAVRGNFKVTDNSGGAVTVVRDDDTDGITSTLADTNELQTKLIPMLQLDGSVYQYTTNALERAPGGSGSTEVTVVAFSSAALNQLSAIKVYLTNPYNTTTRKLTIVQGCEYSSDSIIGAIRFEITQAGVQANDTVRLKAYGDGTDTLEKDGTVVDVSGTLYGDIELTESETMLTEGPDWEFNLLHVTDSGLESPLLAGQEMEVIQSPS